MLARAPAIARVRAAPLSRQPAPNPAGTMASPREEATRRTCACGGGCPRCAGAAQPKLILGDVDDPAEREADSAADRVIRMADQQVAHTSPPALRRKYVKCEDKETLRRRDTDGCGMRGGGRAPPIVHEALAQPGRPLDSAIRADLEPRLGVDFADVRVHDDLLSGRSALAVSAQAYTIGRHVAFAPGRYAPHVESGRNLLIHELVHVAQNGGHGPGAIPSQLRVGAVDDVHEREADGVAEKMLAGARSASIRTRAADARLARTWEPAPAGACPATEDGRWLEKVVVDQEKAQSVTLHWSDGALDSSITSTGKGHCCVDTATNPAGVACSVGESRRNGSNCTPITAGAGEHITDRYVDHNGWAYWSTFVPSRGIGLHRHHTVTGTPLSHGCVRLPEDTARLIFCGARQRRTRVEVRGFARPDCAEPELQHEWQGDFESAVAVSDGEAPDARRIVESNRRESRRILREAYGRELSDAELQQGVAGRLEIPRCGSTAAEPTAEEARALPSTGAAANVPTDAVRDIAAGGLEPAIPAFSGALAQAANMAAARTVVRTHGRQLWARATAAAQGPGAITDDRPLYWARLALTRALREWAPRFQLNAADRDALRDLLERSSRGMDTVSFPAAGTDKRIVISGFDPFGFDQPSYGLTRASNPSGAAALALDGASLVNGAHRGRVESVVFPVRFAEFDAAIVENLFRPFLAGPNAANMIMTISMGSPGSSYEVEEFAGRRRQPGLEDNAGVSARTSASPPRVGAGPEFTRGSLPASARASFGRPAPNVQESGVVEIPAAGTGAVFSPSGPTAGSTSVEGAGGGFLSNEIFYRTTLLRSQLSSAIPAGHLHVPFLAPVGSAVTAQQFTNVRDTIVATVRSTLIATLPDI